MSTNILNKRSRKTKILNKASSYGFIYDEVHKSTLNVAFIKTELKKLERTPIPRQFSAEVLYKLFFKTNLLGVDRFQKNKSRPFLNIWFNDFLNSDEAEQLAKKVALEVKNIRKWLGIGNLRYVFGIWAKENYPHLFQLLFSPDIAQKIKQVNQVPLELFILYVPDFVIFRLANFMNSQTQIAWVAWLAAGNNMRKALDLPFPLTKKMAHWMMRAPKNSSFEEAFLFGQVVGLGGDKDLFDLLNQHFNGRLGHHEFRNQLILFFIRHWAELTETDSTNILGYLDHLNREHNNFNMKGRTVQSLRNQSQEYYENLRAQNLNYWGGDNYNPPAAYWQGADFPAYESQIGAVSYTISQITSLAEIRSEGAIMLHCVASYARRCVAGSCSIWSLRAHRKEQVGYSDQVIKKTDRLITIEVDRDKHIVQARGVRNRLPNDTEESLIRDWAREAKLNIAEY